MKPEGDIPATHRFALFASGASFSCEVLQALRQHHQLPSLLVLPEYPPAQPVSNPANEIVATTPGRRLLTLGQGIEVAYAPEARQPEIAALIQQRAIDFILVACWSYLIDDTLIESPRKAALNLHPSMLPDFRGPNPIEQQLARPGSSFGVTLHLLNDRFDHGDIIARAELTDIDTRPEPSYLEHRCALLGVDLFVDAMEKYDQGWKPLQQTA